jgi:glycosyltransferase involved in cell wall biosynthesis
MALKPCVLTVADHYLPGFRAGGPIRSIANAIRRLAADVDFFVVTRDHDTDGVPYPGVEPGRWHEGPAGPVYYAPRLTRSVLERALSDSGAHLIWLNSFFSRASLRVLMLRRAGRIRQPVMLAPRGELSDGALSLKRRRKAAGLMLMRRSGCLHGVEWLASSALEADEIRRIAGETPFITCVPDGMQEPHPPKQWEAKQPGRLRIVCASRIDRKKNLGFLLEALTRCDGRVEVDVIGPVDDGDYWADCQRSISRLPSCVSVSYRGEMAHADLMERLSGYDVMALPTLGENFGHVVVEAWSAGCPVMVSDRTPWRGLAERQAGWDLPLDAGRWSDAIARAAALDAAAHSAMRRGALDCARRAWQASVEGESSLKRLVIRLARTSVAAADRRRGAAGYVPATQPHS